MEHCCQKGKGKLGRMLGRVGTNLALYWRNRYSPSWNGRTNILRVFNICFRSSAAMLRLPISRFFKRCNTLPKTAVNGEPCPKNLAIGTAFTAVFVTGLIAASSTALKKNFNRKPFLSKELRHLRWTALISKCILMARVRRKKRTAIHRQESWWFNDQNPLHCRRGNLADCSSVVAGFGIGRSRRTEVDGEGSEGDWQGQTVDDGQGV